MEKIIKDYLISIGYNFNWLLLDPLIEEIINGEKTKSEWVLFYLSEGELNNIISIIRDYKLNKILN